MHAIGLRRIRFCFFLSLILTIARFPYIAEAQSTPEFRAMNQPIEPFHIIGDVYYVGASNVSVFLITTSEGHILIDSGFEETVPLIEASMEKLGAKLEDVKLLLCHHGHIDHAGGLAALKKKTGATLIASKEDAVLLADGGKKDFHFGDTIPFPPVKVDHTVVDNEKVQLGNVSLTAKLTPGHTKGCLTWTMKTQENEKEYDVVFVGSVSTPGYQLVDNPKYPTIAKDYARSFAMLKALPCDVFVSYHAYFFQMNEKIQRMKNDSNLNPFVDPQGYRAAVERAENAFKNNLEEQKKSKK